MISTRFLIALVLSCVAAPVSAQDITSCAGLGAAAAIPEPWDQNSHTFANGKVRVAVIDTIEPAGGALYLMVLSPPYDMLGARQCVLVGDEGAFGFGGLDFHGLNASYDPAIGLIWTLPVSAFSVATGQFQDRTLRVTLNQATGETGAEFQ